MPVDTIAPAAQAILDFWFGSSDDDAAIFSHGAPLWFAGDSKTDELIRQRFATSIQTALQGEYETWPETARGRLALIIALDQFTRNVFRGSMRAFAGDLTAQQLCLEGLLIGHDRALKTVERSFFYLPLEHAENLSLQACSVALFSDLAEETGDERYREYLSYAERHRDVIRKYGRFPHRNAALNRQSTDAERDYLAQPGTGF